MAAWEFGRENYNDRPRRWFRYGQPCMIMTTIAYLGIVERRTPRVNTSTIKRFPFQASPSPTWRRSIGRREGLRDQISFIIHQ